MRGGGEYRLFPLFGTFFQSLPLHGDPNSTFCHDAVFSLQKDQELLGYKQKHTGNGKTRRGYREKYRGETQRKGEQKNTKYGSGTEILIYGRTNRQTHRQNHVHLEVMMLQYPSIILL